MREAPENLEALGVPFEEAAAFLPNIATRWTPDHMQARLREYGIQSMDAMQVLAHHLRLTNPTHLAVALLYEHGETPLPLVVAKGAGLQAQAIVRDARAEGIPIIQHIPLARALVAQVEVDDPVPEHLFELVIDVLKAVKDVTPAERPRA